MIDETDFDNLVSFVEHIKAEDSGKESASQRDMTIHGETYKRTSDGPAFLL